MYRILYAVITIFWIFDICNLPFMKMFDTTYPINTTEWFLLWIFIPSYETKKSTNKIRRQKKIMKFNIGEWLIDVKKNIVVTLYNVLENGVRDLYVVYDDDTEEYYITDEDHLIPYDKYYWEREK